MELEENQHRGIRFHPEGSPNNSGKCVRKNIHLFLEYCVYPMSDSTRQGVLTNYVSISPVCYFSPEGIQESERMKRRDVKNRLGFNTEECSV